MKNKYFDTKLDIKSSLGVKDIAFFDVRKEPFCVYGLYNYKTEPFFKRLPDDVGAATSEGVASHSRHTAGGRVRFCTDSEYVAIKCEWEKTTRFSHLPLTGGMSFDMYIDTDVVGISNFAGIFTPPYNVTTGYEAIIRFPDRKKRYLTINFPTYNRVENLYIGIQNDAMLCEGKKYRFEKPVVFYGSSITQGGCASHAGNNYQSILSRHIDFNYINLGFSGCGCGEDSIIDYMASLEMSAFFADYDHNASLQGLRDTHLKMYQKIREKHPNIPYIMMSRIDADCGCIWYDDTINRRRIILETFNYALDHGDRNVYFIDGESMFRGDYEDCCTVDSVHPNDYGFLRVAENVEGLFHRLIQDGKLK